ncbi:hypothetical protein [Scandinavium sp.]|uniref:hypothetical protein n=1 Tax=Scandinavium sp. TaxID=2830653 RepID=UPI00289CB073|nr:hypothetical protein [Scandinavium sp.]
MSTEKKVGSSVTNSQGEGASNSFNNDITSTTFVSSGSKTATTGRSSNAQIGSVNIGGASGRNFTTQDDNKDGGASFMDEHNLASVFIPPKDITNDPGVTGWTNKIGKADNNINSSFSFAKNDGSNPFSLRGVKELERGDAASIYWKEANRLITSFSNDLTESKRMIEESKSNISELREQLSQQIDKVAGMDLSLNDAEQNLANKVEGFESEVVTARNSLLAVIALFASFFTFISISVNVFSRDMSLSTSISVLLVIWSCLISFIFVFMAGISKGGSFFTSSVFVKHALVMVILFFFSFGLPRVIFSIFSIT